MPANDNRSRNFLKELRATTISQTLPGNNRNSTSRDSKAHGEAVDAMQNVSFEMLAENITVGFGIGGL